MRISSFSLRLQPSLMEEAREVARSEGVSLNQLFNVAVAEKLATVRTERGFQERNRRAGHWEPEQTPDRAGIRNPSMGNDKISIERLPMLGATLAHTLRSIDKYHQSEAQPAPPPDLEPAEEFGKPAGRATPQFGKLKRRLEKMRGQ
jgi:HicB family